MDRTPFSPHGIGSTFGMVFAGLAALAQCVTELAEHVASLDRAPQDRTDQASDDDRHRQHLGD